MVREVIFVSLANEIYDGQVCVWNDQGIWEGKFYSKIYLLMPVIPESIHWLTFPWKQHISALNPIIFHSSAFALVSELIQASAFSGIHLFPCKYEQNESAIRKTARVWLARVYWINSVSVPHMLTKFTVLQITKFTLGYSGEIKIKYWAPWLYCPPGQTWASKWHWFIW